MWSRPTTCPPASSVAHVSGLLAPGFIDVQVNGGGGVLFNDTPTVEGIRAIGAAHRKFGTTGFLPTLITDTREKMAAAVAAVRDGLAAGVPGLLGIHLEGPFLNPDRKGAHDRALHAADRGGGHPHHDLASARADAGDARAREWCRARRSDRETCRSRRHRCCRPHRGELRDASRRRAGRGSPATRTSSTPCRDLKKPRAGAGWRGA